MSSLVYHKSWICRVRVEVSHNVEIVVKWQKDIAEVVIIVQALFFYDIGKFGRSGKGYHTAD